MKQIRKTITKAEIAAMPKVLFPGRIFVIYTESEAEKAVAYLKDQRIVGVDTETRPSFKRGTTHKVALLQISTQDTCFLFRLNRIGMPDSLQEFLMSVQQTVDHIGCLLPHTAIIELLFCIDVGTTALNDLDDVVVGKFFVGLFNSAPGNIQLLCQFPLCREFFSGAQLAGTNLFENFIHQLLVNWLTSVEFKGQKNPSN